MVASATDKEMAYYLMQLSEAEKKSVLAMIKIFLKYRDDLFFDEDLDKYNNDIDEAIAEVERGECYSHEEVMAIAKNW